MAARNISQIYDLMDFIIRKERGAFVTIPQGVSALASAQLTVFERYFKLFAETQQIHDALRPFRVYYNFTSDGTGNVTFPADYTHMLASVFTVSGSTRYRVTFISEDEWVDAMNSQLRPATTSAPIAKNTATGFVLFPFQTQSGYFDYLRLPATPVYAYTQTGRTITYNAGGSTQIEFTDVYVNEIIGEALTYWGIYLDDDKITSYGEQLTQENNNG